MSSHPSPESDGTSFPNYIICRPSEDVNMQSVPENSTYNTAGDDTPLDSLPPFAERQLQSFLQRRAMERAENPDLVESRSIPRTNPLIDPTALSALPGPVEQQLLQDNNPARAIEHELGIPSPDDTTEIRHPITNDIIRVVAFSRFNARRRAQGLRQYRITRFQDAESQSRRRDITRRNQRVRRNARGTASGRVSANPSRSFSDPAAELLLAGNLDADDEGVDLNPPLPDPAMNLDNFTARRDVHRRSILSNVISTDDMESADQENSNGMNIDPSNNPAPLPGNTQTRDDENLTDQHRRSALNIFTTPLPEESPSATSTSASPSNSTTEPQARAHATGTGNTTVSSRKWCQNATVRLWEAMYQTNEKMQQVLESMREEPVDEIPISKLSIAGALQR